MENLILNIDSWEGYCPNCNKKHRVELCGLEEFLKSKEFYKRKEKLKKQIKNCCK